MGKFLVWPAGRVAKIVVAVVTLLLFVGFNAAQLPAKFSDNEKNESTSFLPGDAESTKALTASKRLTKGEQAPIIVVYHRDGGLTGADRARIAGDVRELTALRLPKTAPFRLLQASRDRTTALVGSSITADGGDASVITDPVTAIRKRVSDPGGGLQVKVTGGAGFSADAIKVFEGINGTLLLAAMLLVLFLLVIIYRSPIFWILPIAAVIFAEVATRALGYALTEAGVTVNGQSSSLLSILVLGAGTDYALLLVARYREELRRHEDKHEAMALALRAAGPAIVASGVTVMLALLCLSLAKVNGTAGLGPIGAMGIAVAMITMLTVLPALLVLAGRRWFWPRVPHLGDEGTDATHGAWRRVGERVAARPRRVWMITAALLLVFVFGMTNFSTGLTQGNGFRGSVESVQGQKLVSAAFPGGFNAPTDVIVPHAARAAAVARAVRGVDGVAAVRETRRGPSGVLLSAILQGDPYSTQAYDVVGPIRVAAKRAGGDAVLVGGATAVERDLREAATRDTKVIVPLALFVVFLVLTVLLRAVLAPLLLIGTVILSFFASLGVSAVVYDVIFGFPGSDPSLPLFAFIFLVALGIDYNIFLMARVREETLAHGTRQGMLRGVAVTGGVITSAGVVLAGTFAVLGVLPLVFLTEIGFVIAFGVLLDTFVVRSILVPALVFDIGPRIWWPSSLAGGSAGQRRPGGAVAAATAGDDDR